MNKAGKHQYLGMIEDEMIVCLPLPFPDTACCKDIPLQSQGNLLLLGNGPETSQCAMFSPPFSSIPFPFPLLTCFSLLTFSVCRNFSVFLFHSSSVAAFAEFLPDLDLLSPLSLSTPGGRGSMDQKGGGDQFGKRGFDRTTTNDKR